MSDHEPGIWVKTEPTIDGKAYVVTLEFSDDFALTLTPTRAMAYATALLSAAADAEYDHAIFRQMREKLDVDKETAMRLVLDFRNERPSREASGLEFAPGVSARTGLPFVQINGRDGTEYAQFGTDGARRHALHVIEAPAAADLDATYYKVLRSLLNIEEHVARNVVEDIGNWRQPFSVDARSPGD